MTNQQAPAESVHEGWTIATYAIHKEALRQADARFAEERDRRYAEVALEREKALKIKESGDDRALVLARQVDALRDEAHNGLLAQLASERGNYISRTEIKPFTDYVTAQQGREKGIGLIIGAVVVVLGLGFTMLTLVAGLVYFVARG